MTDAEEASSSAAGEDGHGHMDGRIERGATMGDGEGRQSASLMQSMWMNAGYHSDSAIGHSSMPRRRNTSSREMMDPA